MTDHGALSHKLQLWDTILIIHCILYNPGNMIYVIVSINLLSFIKGQLLGLQI